MESRTFDLSLPVSRFLLAGWSGFGALQIASGVFSIESSNEIFGVAQIAFGLFCCSSLFVLPRLNRYVIAFDDSYLTLERALVKPRRIPWGSISEIEIHLMRLEIALKEGKNVKWNFNLSYTDNQIVKPRIIAALTEFSGANGIPIQDGRSG
ncbi:MAG: hypothetical protein OXR72_14635 [Gemmatimonadota bacterium]|nr:hypothetical protein [Gemmatimonadota bacterium]